MPTSIDVGIQRLGRHDSTGGEMLDKIRGKYPGSRIAIIGSAPSALNYREGDHVATIAVNGTSRLLHAVNNAAYFLSGDARAPMQSWYSLIPPSATQILRPMAAIFSPVFVPDDKTRRALVETWFRHLDEHPAEARTLPNRNVYLDGRLQPLRDLAYNNPFYDWLLLQLPDCGPHVVFNVDFPRPLTPEMDKLRRGATSAGCALQVAYLMGATEISMFGVEMSNNGTPYRECNYFYQAEAEERGTTTERQRRYIESIVGDLQTLGIPVTHCGPTRIRNVQIVSPQETDSPAAPIHATPTFSNTTEG